MALCERMVAYSFFNRPIAVGWLSFLLILSLTAVLAQCEVKRRKKSHNEAHYYPTKQMRDHATHMHSLKVLHTFFELNHVILVYESL